MTVPHYNLEPWHLHEIKEQLPVGDYFTINAQGDGIILHDVVTKEPLHDTGTPPGILASGSLKQGFDYLKAHGEKRKLIVQLVLGPHGSAEDFANILAQHSGVLDSSQIVAFEMSSLNSENLVASAQGYKPHLSKHPGRGDFQQSQVAWAQSAGKIIVPSELATDDDSVLSSSLNHLWNEVYEPTLQNKSIAPEIRNAAALIAETAYQRTRQPTILARLGYLLSKLDQQVVFSDIPTRIPLVIGSWHENDKHRLRAINVQTEVYETPSKFDEEPWATLGKTKMSMTYTGRASLHDLGIIPPYY